MNNLRTTYNFWLYKSKQNSNGQIPIYMRIIVGPKKKEISTGIFVHLKNWDVKRGRINGKEPDADIYNLKLDTMVNSFKTVYRSLIESDINYTPELIKRRMLGDDTNEKSLLKLFSDHKERMKSLIGKDYAKNTVQRYETTFNHLQEFLQSTNQSTLLLSQLNIKFLKDFDFYLKTQKNNAQNTAGKYLKNLKKVINTAIVDGYIEKNPFIGFKIKQNRVDKEFLTAAELLAIEKKQLTIPRLDNVRKIFLFQCYTGLAFVDIASLKHSNIVDINGRKWIIAKRTKSNIEVSIPLIDKALDIIKGNLEQTSERIFNIISNQRFNSYLKEIADLCGVNKNITSHMGRHTFATTLTLTQGVSIDVVSKLLGHTKISTTQIYAKVVPEKILSEMAKIDF